MAKTDLKSVDEYIASQPEAVQGILGRVRGAIRKAAPGAQEVISYKMPTYTLHGCRSLYFAVWKQHYSIYAATEQVVAAFQSELASYEVDKLQGERNRISLLGEPRPGGARRQRPARPHPGGQLRVPLHRAHRERAQSGGPQDRDAGIAGAFPQPETRPSAGPVRAHSCPVRHPQGRHPGAAKSRAADAEHAGRLHRGRR